VLEKHIVLQICAYLKSKGLFFWVQPVTGYYDPSKKRFRKHVNPYVKNGVSDILIIHKGRLTCFEVKTAIGRQSEAQKLFERQACDAGARYYLVRSLDDAKNALRDILNS